MEINIFVFLLFLVLVGVVYYFYTIIRNYIVLTVISLIAILLANKYLGFNLSLIEALIFIFVVLAIYTLLEVLNILFNVYEVVKETVLLILSPFKLILKIFKSSDKKKKDEE